MKMLSALITMLCASVILCGSANADRFSILAFDEVEACSETLRLESSDSIQLCSEDDRLLFKLEERLLGRNILVAFGPLERNHYRGRWIRRGRQGAILDLELSGAQALNSGFMDLGDGGITNGETHSDDPVSCCFVDMLDKIDMLSELSGYDDLTRLGFRKIPNGIEVIFSNPVAWDPLEFEWGDLSTTTLSLIVLPEAPMMVQASDTRLGFDAVQKSTDYQGGLERDPRPILRFDPRRFQASEFTQNYEPVIVCLEPEIPARLRPTIFEGFEAWNEGFTSVGLLAPFAVRDWSTEMGPFSRSASYSTVDWKDERGGLRRRELFRGGGNVRRLYDPRSGEIIQANVLLYWPDGFRRGDYFARAAHLDPRVLSWPLSDDLKAELLKWTVMHEAGHMLGLLDGAYGKGQYPVSRFRDPACIIEYGLTPSVMNYQNANYIAQPNDGMSVDLLIQSDLGSSDLAHIRWGYLSGFLSESINSTTASDYDRSDFPADPILEFYGGATGRGPHLVPWAMDVDDPVAAARYGLQNLKIVIQKLEEVERTDESPRNLVSQLHYKAIQQWGLLMRHVVSLVAGDGCAQRPYAYELGLCEEIAKEQQHEAILFLWDNLFDPPPWLENERIQNLVTLDEQSGAIEEVQSEVVRDLLNPHRLVRMQCLDNDVITEHRYSLSDMLVSIRQVRNRERVATYTNSDLLLISHLMETLIYLQSTPHTLDCWEVNQVLRDEISALIGLGSEP